MKLQFVILSVSLLTSFYASADSSVLRCSSRGYSLASLEVIQRNNGSGVIRVAVSEDTDVPSKKFVIRSGLKVLKANDSATLIAQKVGLEIDGGAYQEAVLLRVLADHKSAKFAMDGAVHELICN